MKVPKYDALQQANVRSSAQFWTRDEQGIATTEAGDICSVGNADNVTASISNYSLAFTWAAVGPENFWEAI